MEEIVNYVLNHFGITFDDLKPEIRPKLKNIKARIIITAFLKHKRFKNSLIIKNLHTTDFSNVPNLVRKFKNNQYPDLIDLFKELDEKFNHIEVERYTVIANKTCSKCKETKQNNLNFRRYISGKYHVICIKCEDEREEKQLRLQELRNLSIAEKERLKKEKQNERQRKSRQKKLKQKEKEEKKLLKKEIKIQKASAKREFNRIQKEKKEEKEKIDLEEGRTRQKNKEQELLKNGSRFVKTGIRAYVLR